MVEYFFLSPNLSNNSFYLLSLSLFLTHTLSLSSSPSLPQSEVVRYLLLEANENVNEIDQSELQCTALHYAAIFNHIEVAKFLIDTGKADLEALDVLQGTPFYRAAVRTGNINMLTLLLDRGANINHRAYWNVTALEILLVFDNRPDVAKMLLKKGISKEDKLIVLAMKYFEMNFF